jgi:hypothetical protein
MRYKKLQNLRDDSFRRLTGVKRCTFDKMVEILMHARSQRKLKGGKPNKLPIEELFADDT